MQQSLRRLRQALAEQLRAWAVTLTPPPSVAPAPMPVKSGSVSEPISGALIHCPATRAPLSVEEAVLERSMALLRRETADSLAALAAAHALVSSARFSQLQDVRQQVARGQLGEEVLATVAADYQGWQGDQVRLFDALQLILGMRIPKGKALDQVGQPLEEQARKHLTNLSTEYQRGLLSQQFKADQDRRQP